MAFTRASLGWYFDSSGVLQNAAVDVLRPAYDPVNLSTYGSGNLIEVARTNSIRNPRAEGAVTGSLGTMPTNWVALSIAGLTRQIVSVGVEDGINYVDVRYSGTTNATIWQICCEPTATGIPIAAGQQWTSSVFLRLVAGSFTNFATTSGTCLEIIGYNAAGGALVTIGSTSDPAPYPTSAPLRTQHYAVSGIMSNALVTQTTGVNIRFNVVSGTAVDFTLRIGAPQTEFITSTPMNYTGLFGNGWTQAAVVQSNFQPDPTGASRAIFLTDTAGVSTHFITHVSGAVANNQPLTYSVYVKDAGRRYLRFQIFDTTSTGNQMSGYYDVAAGTLSAAATISGVGTGLSAGIVPVGGGWFRAWITGTLSTTPDTTVSCRLFLYNAPNGSSYGDGSGLGVYLWGGQLEVGSIPGPLINLDCTSPILPPVGTPGATARAADFLDVTSTAGAGILGLSGANPLLIGNTVLTAATGVLAVTGGAEAITHTMTAGAGSLAMSGNTPTAAIDVPLTIGAAGSVTTTGYTPTLVNNTLLQVTAGSLAVTGFAPKLTMSAVLTVTAASIASTSYVPTLVPGDFSRDSSATYFDSTLTLQTAPPNIRRDNPYSPVSGNPYPTPLIEKASTNLVRNPRGEGSVVTSFGPMPTNWAVTNTGSATWAVVGNGVEDGIPYADIRVSGTTNGNAGIQTELTTGIPASGGQVYSISTYLRIVSGSIPGMVNFNLGMYTYTSGGAFVIAYGPSTTQSTVWPTNSPLRTQRYSAMVQIAASQTTVAFAGGTRIGWTCAAGPVDFTVRIGAPQTELLSGDNLCPPILGNWTGTNAVYTYFQPDPNGRSRAALVVDTATSASHNTSIITTAQLPFNGPLTFSMYVKDAGRRYIGLQLLDQVTQANNVICHFDLQTGAITGGPTAAGAATNVSASIRPADEYPVGTGWYRISVTATLSASTASTNILRIYLEPAANNTGAYVGPGVGFYLWGGQLQIGGLTQYSTADASSAMLPPPGSPQTTSRAADAWYINYTAGAAGNLLVTGFAPSIGMTLTAGAGSCQFVGQLVQAAVGTVLTASAGLERFTGQTAALTPSTLLTPTSGAVSVTGQPLTLAAGSALTAISGLVQTTGRQADLKAGTVLTPTAGLLTAQGFTASLTGSAALTVSAGQVSVQGRPVDLIGSAALAVTSGAVQAAGAVISLSAGTALTLTSGLLKVQGAAPTLTMGTILTAVAGHVAVQGQPVDLIGSAVLSTTSGEITSTGAVANLFQGTVMQVLNGQVSIAGAQAKQTGSAILTPIPGAIAVTGAQPQLAIGAILKATAGSIRVAGAPVSLVGNTIRLAGSGRLRTLGQPLHIQINTICIANPGQLPFRGGIPQIDIGFPARGGAADDDYEYTERRRYLRWRDREAQARELALQQDREDEEALHLLGVF